MNNDHKTKKESAIENFATHMNCSQSVMKTFLPELGLEGKEADLLLKSIIGFGGGMGYSNQTCGAISGAVAVLSLKYGYDIPEELEKKGPLYDRIKGVVEANWERYGAVLCDEIKAAAEKIPGMQDKNEFGRTKCCVDAVGFNASLLEEIFRSA